MAVLTTKQRKKIPTSKFALPKERKYPIQDREHAANAKARAQQQYNKGGLSKSGLSKVDAAANKVLKKTEKKSENKKGALKKTMKTKTTMKTIAKKTTKTPVKVLAKKAVKTPMKTIADKSHNKKARKGNPY